MTFIKIYLQYRWFSNDNGFKLYTPNARTLWPGNYDVFNAVTIIHNSQVAIAGLHTNNDSQETDMWITKLNRDATMAQVSSNVDSFYEQVREIFKIESKKKSRIVSFKVILK